VRTFPPLLEVFSSYAADPVDVHPARGTDAVCVEPRNRDVLRDRTEYRDDDIVGFQFEDDLVVEFRHYFVPRRLQVVVDELP